jgi:hypothetical protein
VVDTLGKVRVLDRRGSDRERTKLELGGSPRVLSIAPGTDIGRSAIHWVDREGRLWRGFISGEREQIAAASPGGHLLGPLGSDGERLVAQVGRDSVSVRQGERVLFQRTVPVCQAAGALFQNAGDGPVLLSVPVPEARELHVFDLEGGVHPGTPVEQAGPGRFADLDRDGRHELITLLPDGTLKCLPWPGNSSN